MVIFEKPGCTESEGFHKDVLTLKDVSDPLKQFQVDRQNAADKKTPVLSSGGKKITPSEWFDQAAFQQFARSKELAASPKNE